MADTGWADLFSWQADRRSQVPLFRQVYRQITAGIIAARLHPGTKLPSTRDLAGRLGISRAAVVAAYEQLLAEGYVEGKVGSGTFVAADLPMPIQRGHTSRPSSPPQVAPRTSDWTKRIGRLIDVTAQSDPRPFNLGRALVDARTTDAWRRLTQRALRVIGPAHLGYGDPQGFIELREQIRDYLRASRAVRCDADQILVTAGSQQAVDLAIRTLLAQGDQVWVEDPGYPLTWHALAAAGMALRPIPVDRHGINVAAGRRHAPEARAAVVTPSHQFPTGIVLSMARRLELLAWARNTGAWIIEDDYQSEFRYSGPPLAALQGLDDDERVIYVGTLNKALFPGLRLGYAVLPRPLIRPFVQTRYLIDRQPPSLEQVVLADFMREGHFAGHIRRMRLRYREQRDLLAAELTRQAGDRLSVDIPDQGMHLVAYLEAGRRDRQVEAAALQNGIVVRAISRLYQVAAPRQGLMLGFAGYPPRTIRPAVARLARSLR